MRDGRVCTWCGCIIHIEAGSMTGVSSILDQRADWKKYMRKLGDISMKSQDISRDFFSSQISTGLDFSRLATF